MSEHAQLQTEELKKHGDALAPVSDETDESNTNAKTEPVNNGTEKE